MVFDGNLTSKTQGFSFHSLTQAITDSFSNLCIVSTTSSPAPLFLFCTCIKFNLVSSFTIRSFYSDRVQSRSSTTLVVKWIVLVFEVSPLKKLLRGRYSWHPPSLFLLHVVLFGLIWSWRSEVRPYGDEAMLIMRHHI